eukprot:6200614-Pleurochrysis_carterae.AAC.2
MRNNQLLIEKRRLVQASDVRPFRHQHINRSQDACQGVSENKAFFMHALHATFVHRGVFDEIIWARLPPDHSHKVIGQFSLVIERLLRAEGCQKIATPWVLPKFLRKASSVKVSARPGTLTKVHFLLVKVAFNCWFDGLVNSVRVSRYMSMANVRALDRSPPGLALSLGRV